MVITSDANPFLVASELKHGQILTIGPPSTHSIQEFQQGNETRKRVVIGFAEVAKRAVLNNGSRKRLEKKYGNNSEKWAGKKVEVILTRQMIRNELTDVMFFVPPGTFEKGGPADHE